MQKNITAKFGGSSLATAERIRQAVEIITYDKRRKYIIVSAPGKRNVEDRRITDLLYECSRRTNQYLSFDAAFSIIEKRFIDIGIELKIAIVPKLLDEVYTGIRSKKGQDWIVSRGEWIMAQIVATYVGGVFVDAGDIICLEENGEINSKTTTRMKKFLSKDLLYVIPGFYGKTENGEVKVFPRGGSDITGALVAKYMHCELYENWTDVDGVYTAQPNLVPQAKPLQSLTFQEMRELGYRGAEVIHKDALLPLIKLGVPIEVRNTFKPKSKGTLIVAERQVAKDELIVGIAGRGGFTSIQLQKYGLNDQKGIIEKITLILVDPKRVELTLYNGIPHLLTPVIVEPDKIIAALRWIVAEMENRYKEFSQVHTRNLEGYNNIEGIQKKPYIVFVIDELADLMIFAPGEAEDLITRIAQMARATGIHLVLATQRPSVDVITGLMKANIPTRIALNVSSMIDSRVIIDMPGAEKLLGKGDMLYLPPDQAKPRRIQGPYIAEKEVGQVVTFLKSQVPEVHYTEEITEQPSSNFVGGGVTGAMGGGDKDPLFNTALEIIGSSDKASASLLQRRLSIGYARAARLLDQLEAAGLVGPAEGSKPREVIRRAPEQQEQ